MFFTQKSIPGQPNQAVHQPKMIENNEIKSHEIFKLTTFPKQTIFFKLFHCHFTFQIRPILPTVAQSIVIISFFSPLVQSLLQREGTKQRSLNSWAKCLPQKLYCVYELYGIQPYPL